MKFRRHTDGKISTSLQQAPISEADIKHRNKELQRKVFNEGGAYFMKSDLENMNFVVRLEIEQAMRKLVKD
jgi:hypothetical protein